MQHYKIYVGGEFVETQNKLKVVDPFTQQVFATTYLGGSEELEMAIKKAESIKEELKNLPSYKRYEILMQIANEMKSNRDYLATVLCNESAKPIRYALAEIDRAVQTFIVAAEESKRLPKEYISLDWTIAGEGKEGIVKYFPLGLVAGIAPFNFPMNLAVHKIAPAIAAGCPIILKPASSTPISTLELAKIIDKTALPKGAVSIIPMNRLAGNQLVTDERFKLLSFTGSPLVGWEMKRNAGKKKVVLELGGNAAVIITPSANIEKTIVKCVVGGFAYSGQVCIHAQRFYVHESVFEKFTQEFVEATKKLKQGNPKEAATDISSMIDEENAKRVEAWIYEASQQGATVLLGGKREGTFVEPTIITNTTKSMNVCSEEIFGPVVTIEKYSTFKEAVALVNNSDFGLQAGVFTNELSESDYAFNNIDVGGVVINDIPTFRVDHMPYGGIKDSGLGREGIKYAIMDMMEAKILVK
ncbi:MAG: aldehyde dehydrogenase [Bacteroidetes bacterium RIFCSPLOWO2_12_FULL_35_15]|nr:MAG: aldehyde dehydrogenase [Bacteroidetes bacterium RIFCSPLOWO2_12_FULL_35_15]